MSENEKYKEREMVVRSGKVIKKKKGHRIFVEEKEKHMRQT